MEYKTWSSLISTKTLARLLLGMLIFSGFFCCAAEPVQAFDAQNYKIESITIFKIYNSERQLEERRVLITGQYLKDAAVGMITSSGYEELKKRLNNSEGLLQFEIDQEQTGSFLVVEGVSIALHEGAMPALAGVDRRVRVGVDDLYLTGTNLDAVSQIRGLSQLSSQKIWIARPAPHGFHCEQILPVDWNAITEGGSASTNYQILPGDRVFIAEDKMMTLTNVVAKIVGPFERAMGFSSLSVSTIRNFQSLGQGLDNGF